MLSAYLTIAELRPTEQENQQEYWESSGALAVATAMIQLRNILFRGSVDLDSDILVSTSISKNKY